jgi:hypothetical protein
MKSASLEEIGYTVPSLKPEPGGWQNAVYHKMEKMLPGMDRRHTHRGSIERDRVDGGRSAAGKSWRMDSLPTARCGGEAREAKARAEAKWVCLAVGVVLGAPKLEGSGDTQWSVVGLGDPVTGVGMEVDMGVALDGVVVERDERSVAQVEAVAGI